MDLVDLDLGNARRSICDFDLFKVKNAGLFFPLRGSRELGMAVRYRLLGAFGERAGLSKFSTALLQTARIADSPPRCTTDRLSSHSQPRDLV